MRTLKYIVTFLNINGFYLILAVIAITIGLSKSSMYSVPAKGFLSLLMIIGIIFNFKKIKIYNPYIMSYGIFIFLYTIKILIEFLYPNPNLLHPLYKIIFYIIAHSILPFFFYYAVIKKDDYKIVFNALFYSGLFFNITAYFIYGNLLQEGVGRLGNWQSKNIIDETTLSPLVLAYSSTITIILAVYSLITKKNTIKQKLIYLFGIMTAFPSFLLGASRGAIIGIILSFTLYFLYSIKISKAKFFILLSLLVFIGLNLAITFQSAVFIRFTNLFSSDVFGNERFLIYKTTFFQFVESPIIGGSIQNDLVNHFPHNIYLEALTATGIFGFLAISYLTIKAFKNLLYIFKYDTLNSWIGIIFIVYFVHSLFNAALYLAVGFWMFMALLLGYKKH